MDTTTPRYQSEGLTRWVESLLGRCGISPSHAEAAAQVLARTSLRGIDTHGLARSPGYVERIRAGQLTSDEPEIR